MGMAGRAHSLADAGTRSNRRNRLPAEAPKTKALPVKTEFLSDRSQKMLKQVAVVAANPGFSSPIWPVLIRKMKRSGSPVQSDLRSGANWPIGISRSDFSLFVLSRSPRKNRCLIIRTPRSKSRCFSWSASDSETRRVQKRFVQHITRKS